MWFKEFFVWKSSTAESKALVNRLSASSMHQLYGELNALTDNFCIVGDVASMDEQIDRRHYQVGTVEANYPGNG